MAELESDADVGVTSEGLESDADVGVKSAPNIDSPFPQPVMDKANQFAMSPAEFDMAKYGSGMQDIATAFGGGFQESVGPERLGLSKESEDFLNKHGVFTHFEDEKTNPFSAFGALFGAAASVLDGANKTVQGIYAGAQAAGVAMGLPKDVVSMPDAFMGSPHPTGIPKPYVKPTAIEPIKVGDTPSPIAKPRTELAQTGIPHVDAILNSEPVKSVVDNPVIDRSHTVPNSWSGSDPIENPTTYIDKSFPKELEVEGIKWDPAEPAAVRENVEERAYDALVEGGMAPDVAQKVAYHDVGNPAENAWYASHGIDPEKANARMQPILDRIDQARDTSDVPPDMFTGMYTKGDPAEALPGPFDKPTEAESQQGREILERKFLSGRVATVQEVLNTARDLDVIGPPKPEPTFEGSPSVQAEEAWPTSLSAASTPAEDRVAARGHKPGEYDARGKEWVNKIDAPDDVRTAIEGIANENDWFPEARGGVASPAARKAVAEAAGVDPAGLDADYFAQHFDNDGKVRAVIQALRQTAKDASEASAKNVAEPSPANAAASAEAQMRYTHVLEYTMGLRAESGRTLAAWKELLKDTEIGKEERAAKLLAIAGKPIDLTGLTPDQAARALAGARKFNESPVDKQAWYYWIRNQGLISGLITHTKYGIVNSGMVAVERWVSPTGAALLGKARGENVSLTAPSYGMISMFSQVGDAANGAVDAFIQNRRMPLASEMKLFERGEESPQAKGAKNAYNQSPGPDWGIWNRVFNETQLDKAAKVLGVPGRSANAIHTFFKILSERAAASTTAFETAHKEGVTGDAFWQRYQHHLDNPTNDALRGAVNDAYSGAFMSKLEGNWEKAANSVGNFPIIGPILFPFRHIPINIVRKGFEYSPAAVLDSGFRGALAGEKGAPAQNLAIAKVVVGTSILGHFMMKAWSGDATGPYPTDPKERAEWQLTGKQPFSVRMGDRWVAMERLGPLGMVANLGASLGTVAIHYRDKDDYTFNQALLAGGMAAIGIAGNEAGFQSLRDIGDMMNGDEKKLQRFFSLQAASVVPSFLSQPASAMDPYQRKATDLISALKYRVPGLRESLPVKRDPLYGEPLPNPGHYGSGALGLFRASQISQDPVRADLDRLKIYPTQPQNNVGGVKLPDALYDKYQQVHGEWTRTMLDPVMNAPGWLNVPAPSRTETVQKLREAATKSAKGQMQAMYPQIVTQGMKDTVSTINGGKKTKLQDAPTP